MWPIEAWGVKSFTETDGKDTWNMRMKCCLRVSDYKHGDGAKVGRYFRQI
jgi:hypothetical protein